MRELQQLFVAMADGGRPSADTRGLRKALHDADGKKFELGASPLQPRLQLQVKESQISTAATAMTSLAACNVQ